MSHLGEFFSMSPSLREVNQLKLRMGSPSDVVSIMERALPLVRTEADLQLLLKPGVAKLSAAYRERLIEFEKKARETLAMPLKRND